MTALSTIEPAADQTTHPAGAPTSGTATRVPRRFRRLRRGTAVLAVLLAPVTWSYVGYLRAPGSASWSDRTVEWVRDHGGDGIVNHTEQWWYTRNAPGDGPVRSNELPDPPAPVPARDASVAGTAAGRPPAPIVPLPSMPVSAGEGVWTPAVQSVDGRPVAYTTFLRPDAANTSVVASVLSLDQQLLRTVAVPGTKEPGGKGWAWSSRVPVAERTKLVAAFNSGFRFRHIDGGYLTEGRTAVPLVDGDASVVIDADGRIDVGAWGHDVAMGPDVVSVRQNLHLIVDHGTPVEGLRDNADGAWGKRKHQLQFTWRSGIGITSDGNVVIVAGNKLTLTALAEALSRAGAVRAMQLDIHTGQVSVNLFAPHAGSHSRVDASKLVRAMPKPATRFLDADQRDFFAVFVR